MVRFLAGIVAGIVMAGGVAVAADSPAKSSCHEWRNGTWQCNLHVPDTAHVRDVWYVNGEWMMTTDFWPASLERSARVRER